MILVLTGPNDYSRISRLNSLKNDFLRDHDDFSLEKVDVEEKTLESLIDSVSTLPFLSEKKLVIFNNITSNKLIAENFDKVLAGVSDSTDLIIEEAKFDKRSSLYKALKKNVKLEEFSELKPYELTKWIVDYVNHHKAKISDGDAKMLISRVGPNQLMLSKELDKLISYSSDISKKTIELLVAPTPSSSIFELLETAFWGKHKLALELYEEQRKQQVEPQVIMGMICWQLHIMAVVKLNEDKGTNFIEKEAKLSPYTVSKTMSITNKMTTHKVIQLVKKALYLDKRLKSELINADDALRYFILTI